MSMRQMHGGKLGGEDERVVAKSRLVRHLVSMTLKSVSNSAEFELNLQLWNLRANSAFLDSFSAGNFVEMDSNESSASSSHVPNSCTEKTVA